MIQAAIEVNQAALTETTHSKATLDEEVPLLPGPYKKFYYETSTDSAARP